MQNEIYITFECDAKNFNENLVMITASSANNDDKVVIMKTQCTLMITQRGGSIKLFGHQ